MIDLTSLSGAFFLVTIPAVVLTGLGKGGLGGSLGMLAVPLMSLVVSPVQAAAILLPLLLVMDAFAVGGWRHYIDWAMVGRLLPAGLVGVLVGLLIFNALPENAIRFIVGVISISFSLHQWLGRHLSSQYRPGLLKGYFWSAVAGFTSFGLHAGAPPLSIYLLPQKLDRQKLAAFMAVFFGVLNIAKLPAYGGLGQLTAENLFISALLLPLCPLSVRAGMFLVHRINTQTFYNLLYISLFVAGGKLVLDSLV